MNWREHPKFIFLKEEIEKYISRGEILGTLYLNHKDDLKQRAKKVRRCPLGVVSFNHNIPFTSNEEAYPELKNRFDLSYHIGIGFDHGVCFPNRLYSYPNNNEEIMIGQEIAIFCLENKWIESGT